MNDLAILKAAQQENVCGVCGAGLLMPQGRFLECRDDKTHTTIKPKKLTRTFFDRSQNQYVEYDIMSQEQVTSEKGAALIKYESPRGEVSLSINIVKSLLCTKATNAEAFAFIEFCKYHQLNPFLKEVHLVKYQDSQPASYVVGYRTYILRAEKESQYDGFEAGAVFLSEEGVERRPISTLGRPGERLIGGWCSVYRKDRGRPQTVEVDLAEYIQRTKEGNPNRFWREKPGDMIRKTAVSHAHQDAFPDLMPGATVGSVDHEEGIIEGESRVVNAETGELPPSPNDEPEVTFRQPENVFEDAMEQGRLNKDKESPLFVGNYMYMGTWDGVDRFKDSVTRQYLPTEPTGERCSICSAPSGQHFQDCSDQILDDAVGPSASNIAPPIDPPAPPKPEPRPRKKPTEQPPLVEEPHA